MTFKTKNDKKQFLYLPSTNPTTRGIGTSNTIQKQTNKVGLEIEKKYSNTNKGFFHNAVNKKGTLDRNPPYLLVFPTIIITKIIFLYS